jgi:hypothetical protein
MSCLTGDGRFMFKISIESEIKQGIEWLENIKKGVPSVLSKTLNETAKDVKAAEVEEMKTVFDRPKPFTLNAILIRFASRDNLTVEIGFREWAGKGTPAGKYLMPQVYGENRPLKRSETILGSYWVPAPGARLDQYGNISAGQITQVLSRLGLFGEMGYSMNVTRRSRKTNRKPRDYFIIREGDQNHLHPGVWERLPGHRVRPVLLFIKSPHYQVRFKFNEVAEKTLTENIQKRFNEAIVQGLFR